MQLALINIHFVIILIILPAQHDPNVGGFELAERCVDDKIGVGCDRSESGCV